VPAAAADLVADLKAGLAAAEELAAAQAAAQPTVTGASTVDTSNMPGGVDSAPTQAEPEPAPADELDTVARVVESEVVDIIAELKAGASVSSVANKLLDQTGLESIVKAIGDIAGKVL
jgi:hypothetical protein